MKNLDELLAPIEGDSPTGEDLDDSETFEALRTAFDFRFPIDVGLEEVEEGREMPPPVDWEKQIGIIEDLSDKTKDIFLAASLARCGIAIDDIDTVERGLMMMAGLLETYWEDVHPQVAVLGYIGRKGVCEQIAGRGAFSIPFLNTTILREGRATFRAEQVMNAEAGGPSSDEYAPIKRMLETWDDERKQEPADKLQSIIDTIKRIEGAMKAHADGEEAPGFDTTIEYVNSVRNAYLVLAEMESGKDETEEGSGGDAGGQDAPMVSAGGGGAPLSGEIRSRDDVLRALRAIEQYYERAEPGHPVKIASRRLAGWVNKDFMQILNDIVPNSVDDATNVLLERQDDD